MAAGYYDNNGYTNMYTGPTNSGMAPMNNSTWGTTVINGETQSLCPISATMNGLDGRSSRGHVDDYWILYGSSSTDPYITNGWAQHAYEDCTGDFMGTNQSALGNIDGGTTFYNYTDGSPLYNYTGGEPGSIDGCHGMRDFFESRGYSVAYNYNQYIYGYNGNTLGFTFNQYKNEIDSGRVVLIQVDGHTMLGMGYDDSGNTVYLHDTWDYSMHSMTWGGEYSDMQHFGVTVVKLVPVNFINAAFIANNLFPATNTTVDFTDQSAANPAITSWNWSISPPAFTYVDGTSSASRHPKVQFTAEGTYTVTLIVSNGSANDTEVKTDYIHAFDCSNFSVPFTEDFAGYALPPCWTIADHEGNGQVWSFTNPGNRTINTSTSGNGFAILDSDFYGSSNSQDCDLISPVIDCSDVLAVILSFEHYFQDYPGSSATLSCSPDGGGTWTPLQVWTSSTNNPVTYYEDLSDLLAGQDSVRFKWNYTGTYGFFWAVDDIAIHSEVPGLWVGPASTDWNQASNWADGNVPGSTTDIIIHPQASNWPVYPGNFTIGTNCNSLTLDDGACMTVNGNLTVSPGKSLAFNGDGTLTVTGDWTDQGDFTPGTGTINFSGSSNATLTVVDILSNSVSDYTRTTFPAGMTTLTDASAGPGGTNAGLDVPLGFSFHYMGNAYTQARITTNGYVILNMTGSNSANNNYLFTTDVPNTTLAPWYDYLKADGTGFIRYKSEGTSPNMVFTVEWYRLLTYPSTATSRIRFQLKLFESTRVIEFHYGTAEGGTHHGSESASIGIEDATGGPDHFIEATTGSTTTGIANLKSNLNWPTENYRFTPAMQEKNFHHVTISKTGAVMNLNGNITINGTLSVAEGASLKISSGKTVNINDL